jgi:hypothetical protein
MDITFGLLVAVISATVEIIKAAFNLPTKFCPLVSMALGVGLALWLSPVHGVTMAEQAFGGLLMGLTASGLYDALKNPVKSVIGKIKKP